MIGHGQKADVDIPVLAAPDLVDCSLHVVVDATPRNTAEDAEGVIVGVEQHLVRLQKIGSNDGSPML